ncbi:MAG: hypothetical protein V4697_01880 [Patescibacteria group bacterium]
MTTPILCKRAFFGLWWQDLLGNKPRTWRTVEEFLESDWSDPVSLRYNGHLVGQPLISDIPRENVEEEMKKLQMRGYQRYDYHVTEQFSPSKIRYLINGEAMRSEEGLCLFFSLENKFMRAALVSSGKQVYRTTALLTLQTILEGNDCEELLAFVDRYPNHAVEFSGFNRGVGNIARRKMIIWEIRQY